MNNPPLDSIERQRCPNCGSRQHSVCDFRRKGIVRTIPQGTLLVPLSKEQWSRLKELARYRGISPADCVRRFIDTCKPGGSGWRPPYEK